MNALKNIILRELDSLKKRIASDNCNLTEGEAMDILSVIAHESLSKEQACSCLNVRKSRFGELMDEGEVPQGREVAGFKEKRWYKDELIKTLYNKKRK